MVRHNKKEKPEASQMYLHYAHMWRKWGYFKIQTLFTILHPPGSLGENILVKFKFLIQSYSVILSISLCNLVSA